MITLSRARRAQWATDLPVWWHSFTVRQEVRVPPQEPQIQQTRVIRAASEGYIHMKQLTAAAAMALALPGTALAQDTVFQLDEIIFSAGLTAMEAGRTGVSIEVLTEDELRQAGEIQLSDYLATLPGLSVTRNGPAGSTTNVRIRGANQSFVGVYVDGIQVNDPTSTNGQFSGFGSLTTGTLRRVEILRGSQSAVYGGSAVAGVISVTTVAGTDEPEGTTQTASVEAGSYGTFSTEYGYTQRTGPLTLSFGLSHMQTDGFSAAEENAGNTESDSSQSTRTSFGLIYEVSPNFTVGANAFYETSDGEFDEFVGSAPGDGTPGDETSELDTTGFRVFAEYESLNWSHSVTGTYLQTRRGLASETVQSPFSSPFESDFDGERTTLQYLATADFGETQLSFGMDWQREQATFTGLIGGSRSIETAGAFAEAIFAASPDLDLFASARHETNSAFGDISTWRLAYSYRPNDIVTFRGAVATGYRSPSLSELYGTFPIGNGQFFFGNPDLTPEESVSFELGADLDFGNEAMMSATVFRLEIDNFITYQDCARDPMSFECISSATYANISGVSTFQGVELSASVPISQAATLSAAYTYTDARQADNSRVSRVPRHDLAIGLDATLAPDWTASATVRTVADIMDSASRVGDDYTTMDATIGYALSDGAELYLRIENLLNEDYQTVRGYGTSDRAAYIGIRARF